MARVPPEFDKRRQAIVFSIKDMNHRHALAAGHLAEISVLIFRNRLTPNVSAEQKEGLRSYFGDQFRLYPIQMGVLAELIDIIDRNSEAGRATSLSRGDWLRFRIVTALAL